MWNASREAAKRLFEVVDAEPVVSEQVNGEQSSVTNYQLQITDLTFAYPNHHPRIQNVTFNLQPGTALPLSVRAARGRALIVSLLLRFWEYEFGGYPSGRRVAARRWIRMRSGTVRPRLAEQLFLQYQHP
jgi:ATP-binding cassette, subfamily B, bacterial